MEFVLHHPEQADPIYTEALKSATGLMEVTLPNSVALEVGVPYRWTVFVSCRSSNFSIHTRSFVERTEAPNESELPTASSLDQASFYASQPQR